MPIVEFTEYPDYEAYRAFFYFVNMRRPMAWVNWIVVYGLGPVISLLMLLVILHSGMVNAFTVGYPLLTALLIVLQSTATRRGFKQHSSSFVSERTVFFEDYYAHVTVSQDGNREGSFRYDRVNKAYETATAFYLNYTDKGWGFFPKKFFAPGQVEALRDLFARKFGERFKTKL